MFFQKERKKLKTHLGSQRDPAWYTKLQMRNVVILVIFRFERCKFEKTPRRQCSEDDIVQMLDE